MNRFLNANISTYANVTVETIEKSFICLIEFMKFSDEFQDQRILSYIFPEDFNEKISTLRKRILDYSSEHQKKYSDALEKLDIMSLLDVLETTYKWKSLVIKINNYDDMHSSNDTLVNTVIKGLKQLTSYSHMLESISQKIEELKDELINLELINSNTKDFSKTRDEFYRKLHEKFSILEKAKMLTNYNLRLDLNSIKRECLKSLERKMTASFSVIEKFLGKFSEDARLIRQDYDNFNLFYSNLISFLQKRKVIHSETNDKKKIIEKTIFDKIQTWENSAERKPTVENIAMNLINMKRVSNNIPSCKIRINERIDEVVNHYKMTTNSPQAYAKLGTILNQDKTGVGQSIISEHKSFQGYSLSLFNEKTRRHDINYVIEHLKGDHINKNKLRKRYDDFQTIYEGLIKQHLKPNIELDKLISDTKLIAGNIKQQSDRIQWDAHVRNKVPQLAANIFALWTLKNADHYFEAEGMEDRNNYLRQHHAAQVISVFRMLGIGDTDKQLNNNLVQIGTGEGKSVTLGATASILALLGFDVHCACYSEYLSQRDYAAFLSLFDSLGLLNYIHYGTFNKLCENIINEYGNIRQRIEQLIFQRSNNALQSSQHINRAKILLIDEVDVFFSRNFYGNVYTPSASLRDPTITSLVNLIWTKRQEKPKLNFNSMKITDEYKACCNRFPNWESLLEEVVKDMLSDVNNFESHDYVVNQDKIGYIEQDNIVYNVVYGYKTLFAYHYEHEKGRISKESLDENISIRIKCGSFSYAEIPLAFKYIMGVTGTLETLSDPEKRVIEYVYKIKKNTYTPSVYGKNNLKFTEKDDIMIENSDDYFNAIRKEIDDRLIGKSSEKRAVLILFESKRKLKEFYDSNTLAPIKESVVYLTEEASLDEKENLIKRATVPGQITLLTKTFGRGTDFVCLDQSVAANGGSHVIQTFLSEEYSEEVQIKGRTARQGDHGSYSMVLLDHDLEKFHIEKEHIEDVKKGKGIVPRITDALRITRTYDTVYDLLHDKRAELFKTQYEVNTKYVEQAKERHQTAQKFLLSLNSGDLNSVSKFLVEENKGAEEKWNSRTVCLLDATSSMFHLLHNCKNTVNIMFERASEILKDHKINADSFQIQFVVYRNYNSREDKLLQSSSWETKPDNLRAFMSTIGVEGGWVNEAIEIGLWHANKENERENITQVILIGDAPPNTKNEVNMKRQTHGEKYWKKTKFVQPIYYEDELIKLGLNGIPVHAFFVDGRAEASFKKIANQTKGRCQLLDINSSSGSEVLTDLVTEEILRNVGGSSKGNALVEAYRNKFGRSYIE